jgi:hypothetical protein
MYRQSSRQRYLIDTTALDKQTLVIQQKAILDVLQTFTSGAKNETTVKTAQNALQKIADAITEIFVRYG